MALATGRCQFGSASASAAEGGRTTPEGVCRTTVPIGNTAVSSAAAAAAAPPPQAETTRSMAAAAEAAVAAAPRRRSLAWRWPRVRRPTCGNESRWWRVGFGRDDVEDLKTRDVMCGRRQGGAGGGRRRGGGRGGGGGGGAGGGGPWRRSPRGSFGRLHSFGEAVPPVADRVVGAAGDVLRDLVPLVAEPCTDEGRWVEVEVEVAVEVVKVKVGAVKVVVAVAARHLDGLRDDRILLRPAHAVRGRRVALRLRLAAGGLGPSRRPGCRRCCRTGTRVLEHAFRAVVPPASAAAAAAAAAAAGRVVGRTTVPPSSAAAAPPRRRAPSAATKGGGPAAAAAAAAAGSCHPPAPGLRDVGRRRRRRLSLSSKSQTVPPVAHGVVGAAGELRRVEEKVRWRRRWRWGDAGSGSPSPATQSDATCTRIARRPVG